MDVAVHIYHEMTLNALPCYFLTQEKHISMDVIHVNVALLLSSHALHTSGSTNLTIPRENNIEGL